MKRKKKERYLFGLGQLTSVRLTNRGELLTSVVHIFCRKHLTAMGIEKMVMNARRGWMRAQAEDDEGVTNLGLLEVVPSFL